MKVTRENITSLIFTKNNKKFKVGTWANLWGCSLMYGLYDSNRLCVEPTMYEFEDMVLLLYEKGYKVLCNISDLDFEEVYIGKN